MNKSILAVVLLGIFVCLIQENNSEMVDIAKTGFYVCNTDGQDGLTWLEVEACEVKFLEI